ncbi:MAG: glycosyltransferase family 2 protein [Magnetococcus sp. DMHC-6]
MNNTTHTVEENIAATHSVPFLVSFLSPAYNEEINLPLLYERICQVGEVNQLNWEWVVVDDHSQDNTFAVLCALAQADPRVRGVQLSRNFGSHAALGCGIKLVRGACCMVLAADLQDPPEMVVTLIEKWRQGAHVVWAVRSARQGISLFDQLASRLFYWLIRRLSGLKDFPPNGTDAWLMDRCVMRALIRFPEKNVNLIALINWLGFVQDKIEYIKEARQHGQSGWSLLRKLKLVMDTITSFTHMPIRLILGLGMGCALMGIFYAISLIYNYYTGVPVSGWTSLMVVILFMGGLNIITLGLLGEYVWRGTDEARRRPHYVIQGKTPPVPTRRDPIPDP